MSLTVLVDRHDYDYVVDVVEPDEVDKVQMGWVSTIEGTTTIVVVAAVSTPKNDEQTTRVMVSMHDEMNRIWCYVSLALHGGRISVMVVYFLAREDSCSLGGVRRV